MLSATLRIINGTQSTGNYTTQFISALKANGRMVSTRILKGNSVYAEEDINSCNIYWDASLFKSVMKCAEIEFNGILSLNINDILSDIQVGVSDDNGQTFYYVKYGRFTITEVTYDYDQLTTKVIAYDDMIKAMKPYNLSIEYSESYTNADFFSAILTATGIEGYTPSTTTYSVLSKIRNHETYNDSYTYRDVLDDFAEILGTILYINPTNNVIRPAATDTYTLDTDSDWFAQQLSTFTKTGKFNKINRIILSRAPQEDNVVYSSSSDGEEIKFINNQLVEGYADSDGVVDRTPYLQPIYNQCHSWNEFSTYEFDSYGYLLFQPGDTLNIADQELGVEYGIYLSGNIQITQGIKESGETTAPDSGTTDYTKATSSSQQERDTYLYVDKVNQNITSYIGESDAHFSQIEQTVEGVNTTVSNHTTQITNLGNDIDQVQGQLDNLQIGATNLLLDSNAPSLTKVSAPSNRYFSDSGRSGYISAEIVAISDTPYGEMYGAEYEVIGEVTATGHRILAFYQGASIPLVLGEEYTVSCYARVVTAGDKELAVAFQIGTSPYVSSHQTITSTDWKKFSFTFTATSNIVNESGYTRVYCGGIYCLSGTTAGKIQTCGFMFESGNKATDWEPNADDLENTIATTETRLSNEISSTAEQTKQTITAETQTKLNTLQGTITTNYEKYTNESVESAKGTLQTWTSERYDTPISNLQDDVGDLQGGVSSAQSNINTMQVSISALQTAITALQNGIGKAFVVDSTGTKVYAVENNQIIQGTYTLTDELGNHYFIDNTETSWATATEFGCVQLSIGKDVNDTARWRTVMNENTLDDIYHA